MSDTSLDIPQSNSVARLRIVDQGCRFSMPARSFIKPVQQGQEQLEVPDIAFLIEHAQSEKKIMFDLGVRKDYWNLPGVVLNRLGRRQAVLGIRVDKDVTEVLEENSVQLSEISAVVWSHYHWDHTGNMALFPPSTRLIVGPGFKASPGLLPGYPENPTSPVSADAFANREVQEIDFSSSQLTIGGFRALDFFSDGSFYLLDTPGHCLGHMCGLVRTSPSPKSTFVLLGGDACHSSSCLRPSPGYPLPRHIPDGVLDQDQHFPSMCPAEVFTQHHPQDPEHTHSPDDLCKTPFHRISTLVSSAYTDPATAQKTIDQLRQLDESPSVLTTIAHDPVLVRVLPTMITAPEQDLNDWKEQGYKEKCHWDWLNCLPRRGMPGREQVVREFWRNNQPWPSACAELCAAAGEVTGTGL
ncbi:hypothetical protein FE257_008233 [Aspergillus nanangensis]|uniref:Metallo-beta-lactamase domain-containing protein n=1 Tax=Aspergillus nanangensis TaxID=2582783 RepID=A0AAD4CLR7_ASPNN|nr:hypothetical protein FE257_008233 [Aspergillus nanangensis]